VGKRRKIVEDKGACGAGVGAVGFGHAVVVKLVVGVVGLGEHVVEERVVKVLT